jgi:hypothetical protein
MNTFSKGSYHKSHFMFSLGYSLALHVIFSVVILYSFPVHSLTMDRPLSDYIMVMLPDKTEVVKEPPKPKVRAKKPKPMALKQAKPIPKEPEPPKPPPQEEPPPPPVEPEPPPPVVQQPEPVVPPEPTPEPVVQEPEPEVPPVPEPEPVLPVQEPEAQTLPPVEPEPIVELPPPAPEPVLPLEESTTLPPVQEVAPPPPPLEPAVEALPAPEPPIVVSKTDEVKQEQPEPEVHALVEEPRPAEPVSMPPVTPVIVVTEPHEGAILNVTGGNTVTIRGTVDDPEIKTATVILNDTRVEVEVHEGRFETTLSNITEENSLHVEATNAAGLTGVSALIRFFTTRPEPRDVQVILSCKASCADVRLTTLKGEHPQSRGYQPFKPPMEIESSTIEYLNGSPYLARLMAISKTDSGVYTIRLDPHSSQTVSDCDPHLVIILYGYDHAQLRTRVFRPSTASHAGAGAWILARFLMPQGFFWDDDDWTTGQIEDSRSVTKFSSSLGIVWKELK